MSVSRREELEPILVIEKEFLVSSFALQTKAEKEAEKDFIGKKCT